MAMAGNTKRVLTGLLLVAAIVGALVLVRNYQVLPTCSDMHAKLDAWGNWSTVVYVVVSTVASLVFIPRTPFVVLAGFGFSLGWGSVLVTISSLTSAALSFVIARYLARGWVEKLMARHGVYEKLA